jgi:hypothetical protein
MTKRFSAADWRLLCAVLAVIVFLVATEPTEDCFDCENIEHSATFVDLFHKQEKFADSVLPNAHVIVHNGLKGDLALIEFSMVSGDMRTVELKGQEAYSYLILELDWSSLDELSTLDSTWLKAQLLISNEQEKAALMKPYAKPIRCISVGIILEDTTISFTSKGEK